MIFEIDNIILTEELFSQFFACDLNRCQGACCVAGDAGAPLEDNEVEELKKLLPTLETFLSTESISTLKTEQVAQKDTEGEWSTTLLKDGTCAFAVKSPCGLISCGIEVAWKAGKTTLRKPISCQLYPLKIKKSGKFTLVNYHKWDICQPACENGCKLNLPLFKFLKEALIRAFGEDYYQKLEIAFDYYKQNNKN